MIRPVCFCLLAISLIGERAALAFDLPPVNLGFTSFLDGAPPAGPGLYLTQYVQYYSSDSLEDGPPGHDVDAWIGATQMFYQSEAKGPWGSKLGIDTILFYADLDASPSNSPFLQSNSAGIGDILIGPYLQWDPVMGEHGPKFVHRVEFQMMFPTGKYSDQFELNPGANVFSFNPYWAATAFHSPNWSTSWRLHYLWNGENDDPSIRTRGAIQFQNPSLEVNDIQAGQAVHLNFATAVALLPNRFRVGLNGYYLKQISDTKVDGQKVRGRREE
ncbi:MAG: transporter, partial [Xanthomonadales bacterium]|nr:transporter [Xanthomonadales bacterium]